MGEERQESPLMICLICRQAEIAGGITSVIFQRGEMHLQIDKVPARVCPSCGEAYVEEAIAARLLQRAQEIYQAGDRDVNADYE
ncbi:MAG: type II toxin-antitoxin system MqsA family antitoxin [Chloroflexota bacterium]|nr:type II toxin-antitoxin system MqsA family antitoxin [Chloroflexota bacterium]